MKRILVVDDEEDICVFAEEYNTLFIVDILGRIELIFFEVGKAVESAELNSVSDFFIELDIFLVNIELFFAVF